MGNQELFAIELTLEEWRHWLEGMDQSIIVWTNIFYKNLVHKEAELSFGHERYVFISFNKNTLTYHPRSQNVKPNSPSLSLPIPLTYPPQRNHIFA